MNYQQFIIVVKNKVSEIMDDNMSLQLHTALKNNGKERVGLTLIGEHTNISPTIYLEEYYKQFQNGISIRDIAENILDIYHEVKFEHTWQIHTVKSYELMRSKIVYKLIHGKKNEALLKTMPHIPYLDFAIVFYILFEASETGTANIPITHELMKLWDVSFDSIQKNAFLNAPSLLPASFKPMKIVIHELMGTNCDNEDDSEEYLYVLTNSLRSFGASCILYEGVLKKIGEELGENFFILPSSIHEMIIAPESKSPCRMHLHEMISEINQTQVDEEEVLSNQVYYYNRESEKLS